MGKRIALIMAVAVMAVFVVAAPRSARAQITSGNGGQSTINGSQTVDDDLYVIGKDVLIEGTVNGDVYAAGSSVTIRGTVNGDVFAAGSDILVGGAVKGSVRAAGSTVRLTGATIGNSVSAFGSSITVEKDSKIDGGLNFAGASAAIRGSVGRSVVGAADSITMAGSVGKDVDITASSITLESAAVLSGHLNYYGQSELHRDQGAQVKGQVQQLQGQTHHQDHRRASTFGILWGLIALYLTGVVTLWLFPRTVVSISSTLHQRPGGSVGTGVLIVILFLPALLVLLLSLVGIPLGILAALGVGVGLYVAKFIVGLTIGNLIARRTDWKPNPYADVIIGLLIITLLELIPGFGLAVRLIVAVAGLGAIFLTRFGGSGSSQSPKATIAPKPSKG
jgi:cytoskeletal protein CcmA (bactofilin family)